MHKLFDTHAHYTDEKFDNPDELLKEIFAGDVGYITCVASNIEDSIECINYANRYDNIYASAGIHPHECEKLIDINADMQKLEQLLTKNKVVALGEIGLDYHYDKDWEIKQKEYFDAQLSLSEKLKLPVIIHDREAHMDVFDIIKSHPNSTGIIHSCSESNEMVKEYIKRGWYISFSGTITFKNASKVLDAVKATPLDRILVETDCPYLAPVPMRGTINSSLNLHYTAEAAANTLGVDYDTFCDNEMKNAKTIFKIN
ncbi:MAG: TatD family hydrolase [Clostridia bacterium]|nr:TatD family hydrolase [Clostridia bacterium]